MPKFHVSKSKEINVSVEQVYASLIDFKQWKSWSPWIIAEPDCKLQYADDGSSYQWEGKIVGSGEMSIMCSDPNRTIDYQLNFLKPFKSKNTTGFLLEPINDGKGTRVTWNMTGSLPVFMFFMKSMMECFIGMDYDRGLEMLKDLLESGSVHCDLDFKGVAEVEGFTWIGKKRYCSLDDMSDLMGKDMQSVGEWLDSEGIEMAGLPISIYTKWKASKKMCEYITAIPVAKVPSQLGEGLMAGTLPTHRSYAVHMKGPYRFLGNAWACGMMHGRGKVFKQSKKIMPFERYENDPKSVDENDLETTVFFPAK